MSRILSLICAVVMLAAWQSAAVAQTSLGAGSYLEYIPAGKTGPTNAAGAPAAPLLTAAAAGRPVSTNEWWSTLVWPYSTSATTRYSGVMFADPLVYKAEAAGLRVGGYGGWSVNQEYHYSYGLDLFVTLAGLNAPDTRVDDWGDWHVTALWDDGPRALRATFGHGMPYVYFERVQSSADVVINVTGSIIVREQDGKFLAIRLNGREYLLAAPNGATWTIAGSTIRSTLNGQDYFSIARLPDNATSTRNLFKQYAYSFVVGTTVTWDYDEATADLTSTFTAATQPREGAETGTLHALYRHQWKYGVGAFTNLLYASPRGLMKLKVGAAFQTRMRFNGVLPTLPDVGSYNRQTLTNYINQETPGSSVPGGMDTYWGGKALGRAASLAQLADVMGLDSARDEFLSDIRISLQNWLRYTGGGDSSYFYYDPQWGTLIGWPTSFNSDRELNDHHFHYGYHLMAAATLGQFDPGFLADDQYGQMLRLIIRDVAATDPNDPLFPRLRNFDAYAGHGWASGHAAFGAGNNQESSSESMNFNAALILLGALMNDTEIRDLGIFLYTQETAAIEEYWFDVDDEVFPANFTHEAIAILWGDGGAYGTWWTGNPEEIHGILFLPITGGSLYLGRRPDYILRNYNHLVAENNGPPNEWRDIIWSFLAFAQPETAIQQFIANPGYGPEAGESKAHTYHWIHALNVLGQLDTEVTANTPTYAVFNNDGARTYVAFNPSPTVRRVTFSDGAWLNLQPYQLRAATQSDRDPLGKWAPVPATPGMTDKKALMDDGRR